MSTADGTPTEDAGPSCDGKDRAKTGLFTQIAERDYSRIKRGCPRHAHGIFAAWCVLLWQACRSKSLTFTLSTDIVADRVGVSRRQLHTYLIELRKLGLTKTKTTKTKAGKYTPMRWTLLPSVTPSLVNCTSHGEPVGTVPHTSPVPILNDSKGELLPPLESQEGNQTSPSGGLAVAPQGEFEHLKKETTGKDNPPPDTAPSVAPWPAFVRRPANAIITR